MILPYATKYNGKYYNAGEEIPVDNKVNETKVEKPIEKADEPIEEKPVEKKVAVKKQKK